ncbi:MAG: hypothetical protein QOF83_4229 [Solirubrobacteraceae bacterium]|nr:hypothetical protein [Solirubrobacteraceae bacterium]
MGRPSLARTLVILGVIGLLTALSAGRARAGDAYCTGQYGGAAPRVGAPLRFGVDPGVAGSAGSIQLPSAPDDLARDVAGAAGLHAARRVLVVRLNRLFWSDGQAGITHFQALVARYAAAGLDVELQVRYHPGPGEDGNLAAWAAYVRHVVDVFGPDRHVVAMTITNEVNLTFSPNTSDGSYTGAKDALIRGIEAAHAEAVSHGFRQLRFGFTYAYRFSPQDDAAFFAYLGAHGGTAFRAALGFVGLDFYPGSVYPPVMAPGDSYRAEMAQALGTVRSCFAPRAAIAPGVPIWITENGVPTGAGTSEAAQAGALGPLVAAARDYSGTFDVSDYRWFNLRDANSTGTGSLPGVAASFATDGLLRDDYTPKPAYSAYRAAIAAYGRCAAVSRRLALRRQPRPVRRAVVLLDRRPVGRARGRRLRSVRVRIGEGFPSTFTLRFVLRLRGGRTVAYRRRFHAADCRVASG